MGIGGGGGAYPKMYHLFTDAHNGQVNSQTSMGFQADDPTDLAQFGRAVRDCSDGTNACIGKENAMKCTPLCPVNAYVME